MMSKNDFKEKQIIFLNLREKEKLAFKNENIVLKDCNEKIKLQVSCYKIFAIFIIGELSITSVLLSKAKKYSFSIILMNYSFRCIQTICNGIQGNTLLHRKQYEYCQLDIAKHIILNKVHNQRATLNRIEKKPIQLKKAITDIDKYISNLKSQDFYELSKLMSIEGKVAKIYFKQLFKDYDWNGRKPRVKMDYLNVILDIGYTLLFNYIEAVLALFDFDLYIGVLHTEFYKRKSLVCDIIEPFRYLIDEQTIKSLNLKQFKKEDFGFYNSSYYLKNDRNKKYIEVFIKCISDNKMLIFNYVQSYYRAFMKNLDVEKYPVIER